MDERIQTPNYWFQQLSWCRLRHMITEHARNIVALLWRPSGPQSLVMLPAKMADRIMLPDKVTEMENSIGYHTSIKQSEESISIRCIIICHISGVQWWMSLQWRVMGHTHHWEAGWTDVNKITKRSQQNPEPYDGWVQASYQQDRLRETRQLTQSTDRRRLCRSPVSTATWLGSQ